MLGKVVAAGEALGAERAGEALLPRVRPVVAGQLVGARKLLVTARPVAGEGALTWMDKAEGRDSCQWVEVGGTSHQLPKHPGHLSLPHPLVLEAEFWV